MTTPPGLTCAECEGPFVRPQTARRTRRGWVHTIRCGSLDTLDGRLGRWVQRHGISRWIPA